MGKIIDISNCQYYDWFVLPEKPIVRNGSTMWKCRCVCGTEKYVSSRMLRTGRSRSCRCSRRIDMTGRVFGRLTVLSMAEKRNTNGIHWNCRCECGSMSVVSGHGLRRGVTKSCGCLQRDLSSIYHKTQQFGENNPSWNKDLSEEDRSLNRTTPECWIWRRDVLKLGGYRCKICRSENDLRCHHLDGWHWCKKRRYDIDNGVVLCVKCHNEFHKIYGNRNNTAEEFFEFFLIKGSF